MIEDPRRVRKRQSSVLLNLRSARIEKTGMNVASIANSKPISLQFAPLEGHAGRPTAWDRLA